MQVQWIFEVYTTAPSLSDFWSSFSLSEVWTKSSITVQIYRNVITKYTENQYSIYLIHNSFSTKLGLSFNPFLNNINQILKNQRQTKYKLSFFWLVEHKSRCCSLTLTKQRTMSLPHSNEIGKKNLHSRIHRNGRAPLANWIQSVLETLQDPFHKSTKSYSEILKVHIPHSDQKPSVNSLLKFILSY